MSGGNPSRRTFGEAGELTMGVRRIGMAIGRREITLAGVEGDGKGRRLALQTRRVRAPGATLAASIKALLAGLDPGWQRCEVRIALSPSDLACADVFEVPFRTETQVQAVAGSLAEGRSTGESAENLAVDALLLESTPDGSRVELTALPIDTLEALRAAVREALPQGSLTLVTALPAVLARAFVPHQVPFVMAFQAGGEGFILAGRDRELASVRAFPLENGHPLSPAKLQAVASGLGAANVSIHDLGAADEIDLKCGVRAEPAFACAAAVTALNVAALTNVLRGAPDAPRSIGSKLERPLLLLAGAAALLLFAAGLVFHVKARRAESALERTAEQERKLWNEYLPGQPYRADGLAAALKRVLNEQQRTAEANRGASALAIWGELGKALPDPDTVGLVLDSMQLDTAGGRFTAKVDAKPGDPLANAALLEHALNSSERLSARGEFETRDNAVTVRMRLDYRTPRQGLAQTRAEAAKP
ncbi:MAG: hypothetical protein HY291_05075 [Planctomycetes bacterium]|nr:hypothetical protein [Planctomycetota bacterium]